MPKHAKTIFSWPGSLQETVQVKRPLILVKYPWLKSSPCPKINVLPLCVQSSRWVPHIYIVMTVNTLRRRCHLKYMQSPGPGTRNTSFRNEINWHLLRSSPALPYLWTWWHHKQGLCPAFTTMPAVFHQGCMTTILWKLNGYTLCTDIVLLCMLYAWSSLLISHLNFWVHIEIFCGYIFADVPLADSRSTEDNIACDLFCCMQLLYIQYSFETLTYNPDRDWLNPSTYSLHLSIFL